MKAWLLRLHRWLALIFALPLVVVIGTGVVLSFEPWVVTAAITPGTLSSAKVQALLAQHDPRGQARNLINRSYDNTLALGAGRGNPGIVVDVTTGELRSGPSRLARIFGTTRGLHERLMLDADWVVIASSAVMLGLALLGVLMGWPRLTNSLAGWHKGVAWTLLPLIILSPLTGLLMAGRVTFTEQTAAPAAQGAAPTLSQAVEVVGREHDLSGLMFIRPQGSRLIARLAEGGEYRNYVVTRESATALPRNWPRLWHEGNFAGAWSAAMNAIISLAMSLLLATGVWIWVRRQVRRRELAVGRVSAERA